MSTAIIITINAVLVAGVVLAVNGLLLWAIATQHRDRGARRSPQCAPES